MAPRFQVSWTEQAFTDLTDIVRYIALDSPQSALRVYKRIRTRANTLKTFPERGHVVPELAELGVTSYSELAIPPWRIIYRINEKTIGTHLLGSSGAKDFPEVENADVIGDPEDHLHISRSRRSSTAAPAACNRSRRTPES
jgi:toxin ParE1/3/4